jgi:hypothetical protein
MEYSGDYKKGNTRALRSLCLSGAILRNGPNYEQFGGDDSRRVPRLAIK